MVRSLQHFGFFQMPSSKDQEVNYKTAPDNHVWLMQLKSWGEDRYWDEAKVYQKCHDHQNRKQPFALCQTFCDVRSTFSQRPLRKRIMRWHILWAVSWIS